MIDWLILEIKMAEEHLADLEAGATVLRADGADVTHGWISEYQRRIKSFKDTLEAQGGKYPANASE